REHLASAERQAIIEIGLERVRKVKAGAPSLGPRVGIVNQRREVALRAIGVIKYFAVSVTALENQVFAKAALDLNDSSVITRTREILNQIGAANELVRRELPREGLESINVVDIGKISDLPGLYSVLHCSIIQEAAARKGWEDGQRLAARHRIRALRIESIARSLLEETVRPRAVEVGQEAVLVDDYLVDVQTADQIRSVVAQIGNRNGGLESDRALNGKIPILNIGSSEVGRNGKAGIVRDPEIGGVLRERRGNQEGRRCNERGGRERVDTADRRNRVAVSGGGRKACVSVNGVEHRGRKVVIHVVNAIACAHGRFAVAKRVPGDTNVGSKVVKVFIIGPTA